MDNTDEQIQALQSQITALSALVNANKITVADLQNSYYFHKHLGYDKTQPLPVGTKVYGGTVKADATWSLLPPGWTVSVNGSNLYTITHNLGTGSYTVVAQPFNSGNAPWVGYSVNIGSLNSVNSFVLDWFNSSGVRSKSDFSFMLIVI